METISVDLQMSGNAYLALDSASSALVLKLPIAKVALEEQISFNMIQLCIHAHLSTTAFSRATYF